MGALEGREAGDGFGEEGVMVHRKKVDAAIDWFAC